MLELDKQVLLWINSHHNIVLDSILGPIAYAGEGGIIWIAVCLYLLVSGRPGYRRTAVLLLISMIAIDRLIASPLGHLFDRPRPYVTMEEIRQLGVRWTSGSFPSGHGHNVWVSTIILSSKWPSLKIPLIIFAILTCYSRPYFGMHYPIDTLAGAAIGIIFGLLAVKLDRWLAKRKEARILDS